MIRLRPRTVLWLAPVVCLTLAVAFRGVWLKALGSYLVRAEEPAAAEMIVVLAGDDSGSRVLKAAELARQGYAPRILVSGNDYYGVQESELAVAFAVQHGYPREWFLPLRIEGRSTEEESHEVMRELRRLGVRNFLVVTSNYHTRRAARIYAALAPRSSFRMVAAPSPWFRPEDWWRHRQGQKIAFMEWSKTLDNWVAMCPLAGLKAGAAR